LNQRRLCTIDGIRIPHSNMKSRSEFGAAARRLLTTAAIIRLPRVRPSKNITTIRIQLNKITIRVLRDWVQA
jgi:hypothetical protein